ncbi:myosin-like coiled-coil protein-domain-containing protein [Polychytrium aggregatum]|uniref:myosin-like coiled-coil protein-domain-containing protein n=1 Tax=Polychytrium aggregatum TaxID=110093 RepID=UPI0022FE45E0|nr:myosin-like coiled-coil protein-domain-containing protein [Polychytrium aggregatum]KAI9209906.1 myosin-like coiled-coil protein-domain-containing protein [Polychytrium aggregatum]
MGHGDRPKARPQPTKSQKPPQAADQSHHNSSPIRPSTAQEHTRTASPYTPGTMVPCPTVRFTPAGSTPPSPAVPGPVAKKQPGDSAEQKKNANMIFCKIAEDLIQLLKANDQDSVFRIDTIRRRASSLYNEFSQLQAQFTEILTERDSIREDWNKITVRQQKMESLCRDLQSENKRLAALHEDTQRITIGETQKREELAIKYESKMDEMSEEYRKHLEEHEMLKSRFEGFLEQYQLREHHFDAVVQAKELELELERVKQDHQRQETEKELRNVAILKSQISSFVKTEEDLRRVNAEYLQKIVKAEDTLRKNNELVQSYQKALQSVHEEKQSYVAESSEKKMSVEASARLKAAEYRMTTMEGLCRALQTERDELRRTVANYEAILRMSSEPVRQQFALTNSSPSQPNPSPAMEREAVDGDNPTEMPTKKPDRKGKRK